jgi:hypothetical protein
VTRACALLLTLLVASSAVPQVATAQLAERSPSAAASPAARPFGGTPGQPRLTPTLQEPFGTVLPNASRLRSEPAPIPNRDIEAPASPLASGDAAARLEPMLLPPERGQGMTFGREHLRATGIDRPFDNIVPGARLRIPFEGSGGRQ